MSNNNLIKITSTESSDTILEPLLRSLDNKEIQKINLVIKSNKEISTNKLRQVLSPGKTLYGSKLLSIIPALIVNINDELDDFLSKDKLIELNKIVSNNNKSQNIFNTFFLKNKLSINDLVNIEQQYSNLIELINIATLQKHNELCFTKKAKMQFMMSKLMLLSIYLKILMGRIKEFNKKKNSYVFYNFNDDVVKELRKLKKMNDNKKNNTNKKNNDFDWLIKKLDAAKNFTSKTIYFDNTASFFSKLEFIAKLSFWATIYKKVFSPESRTLGD